MEKSYRNTTQEIINARKQKKKVGKSLPQFPRHCVVVRVGVVISGQPIFLPRDANFRAKLPSHSGATKSLVTVFCISH